MSDLARATFIRSQFSLGWSPGPEASTLSKKQQRLKRHLEQAKLAALEKGWDAHVPRDTKRRKASLSAASELSQSDLMSPLAIARVFNKFQRTRGAKKTLPKLLQKIPPKVQPPRAPRPTRPSSPLSDPTYRATVATSTYQDSALEDADAASEAALAELLERTSRAKSILYQTSSSEFDREVLRKLLWRERLVSDLFMLTDTRVTLELGSIVSVLREIRALSLWVVEAIERWRAPPAHRETQIFSFRGQNALLSIPTDMDFMEEKIGNVFGLQSLSILCLKRNPFFVENSLLQGFADVGEATIAWGGSDVDDGDDHLVKDFLNVPKEMLLRIRAAERVILREAAKYDVNIIHRPDEPSPAAPEKTAALLAIAPPAPPNKPMTDVDKSSALAADCATDDRNEGAMVLLEEELYPEDLEAMQGFVNDYVLSSLRQRLSKFREENRASTSQAEVLNEEIVALGEELVRLSKQAKAAESRYQSMVKLRKYAASERTRAAVVFWQQEVEALTLEVKARRSKLFYERQEYQRRERLAVLVIDDIHSRKEELRARRRQQKLRMLAMRDSCAVCIQSAFRGCLARRGTYLRRLCAVVIKSATKDAISLIADAWRHRVSAAVRIQALSRGRSQREVLKAERAGAVKIQRLQRRRQRDTRMNKSAAKIQAVARGREDRRQLKEKRDAAVILQALTRGRQQRKRINEARAATTVQATYRMSSSRRQFRTRRRSAVRIQSLARGRHVRCLADGREVEMGFAGDDGDSENIAAAKLQSMARMRSERRRFQGRREAAGLIQARARGYRARSALHYEGDAKRQSAIGSREDEAAMKLQSMARMRSERQHYQRRRQAAVCIQARARGYSMRSLQMAPTTFPITDTEMRFTIGVREDEAATRLQSMARMRSERQHFQRRRQAAVCIQARARGHNSRSRKVQSSTFPVTGPESQSATGSREDEAAMKLQSMARMRSERQHYQRRRQAAVCIQARARGYNMRSLKTAPTTFPITDTEMQFTIGVREDEAATRLQSMARMRSERQHYQKRRQAAVCIQARARGYHTRSLRKRSRVPSFAIHHTTDSTDGAQEIDAAKNLQSMKRMGSRRQSFQSRREAAVRIQSLTRGRRVRSREKAASKMQSMARMRAAKAAYASTRNASVRIQARARGYLSRQHGRATPISKKNRRPHVDSDQMGNGVPLAALSQQYFHCWLRLHGLEDACLLLRRAGVRSGTELAHLANTELLSEDMLTRGDPRQSALAKQLLQEVQKAHQNDIPMAEFVEVIRISQGESAIQSSEAAQDLCDELYHEQRRLSDRLSSLQRMLGDDTNEQASSSPPSSEPASVERALQRTLVKQRCLVERMERLMDVATKQALTSKTEVMPPTTSIIAAASSFSTSSGGTGGVGSESLEIEIDVDTETDLPPSSLFPQLSPTSPLARDSSGEEDSNSALTSTCEVSLASQRSSDAGANAEVPSSLLFPGTAPLVKDSSEEDSSSGNAATFELSLVSEDAEDDDELVVKESSIPFQLSNLAPLLAESSDEEDDVDDDDPMSPIRRPFKIGLGPDDDDEEDSGDEDGESPRPQSPARALASNLAYEFSTVEADSSGDETSDVLSSAGFSLQSEAQSATAEETKKSPKTASPTKQLSLGLQYTFPPVVDASSSSDRESGESARSDCGISIASGSTTAASESADEEDGEGAKSPSDKKEAKPLREPPLGREEVERLQVMLKRKEASSYLRGVAIAAMTEATAEKRKEAASYLRSVAVAAMAERSALSEKRSEAATYLQRVANAALSEERRVAQSRVEEAYAYLVRIASSSISDPSQASSSKSALWPDSESMSTFDETSGAAQERKENQEMQGALSVGQAMPDGTRDAEVVYGNEQERLG